MLDEKGYQRLTVIENRGAVKNEKCRLRCSGENQGGGRIMLQEYAF